MKVSFRKLLLLLLLEASFLFFSNSFNVSGLRLKYLIHLELIFLTVLKDRGLILFFHRWISRL